MISIIIPTYDEAEQIAETIIKTHEANGGHQIEIIVADGGSADETVPIALRFNAIAIVSEKKGRAAQMNKGASVAKGDVLYFLHADSIPPKNFTGSILKSRSRTSRSPGERPTREPVIPSQASSWTGTRC